MANRQVFPRDTVSHLWAHASQDSARDPSGNFYFTGPTLYSYGTHFAIAHIMGDDCGKEFAGRVLWNRATYSNTTTKMQSIAWRALTGEQRARLIYIPSLLGLGDRAVPSYFERYMREKRMPDFMPQLLNSIVERVAELPKKKRGGSPFCHTLHRARESETLAMLIYSRVGRKYPFEPIPQELPEEKSLFLDWVKSYASKKMRADYSGLTLKARQLGKRAIDNYAASGDVFPYFHDGATHVWHGRNKTEQIAHDCVDALSAIRQAKQVYSQLHDGKKAPGLEKLEKQLRDIAAISNARGAEFKAHEERRQIVGRIREACITLHNLRQALKSDSSNVGFMRALSEAATLAERARACNLSDTLYLSLAERVSRVATAAIAWDKLREAGDKLAVAESYVLGSHHSDVIYCAKECTQRLDFISRTVFPSAVIERMAPQIQTMRARAGELTHAARSALAAREADILKAWLAGESNNRPSHQSGTYARINGDKVETNLGASVPIAHACRLARLYMVTVRRGGQKWSDGTGPIVGHFRVNSISQDGAIIIGCHDFEASEAMRMYELLSNCDACKGEIE